MTERGDGSTAKVPAGNGPAGNGSSGDGPTGEGVTSYESASDGTTSNGSAGDGSASKGTTSDTSTGNDPAAKDTASNNTANNEPAKANTATNKPAINRATSDRSAGGDTAGESAASNGTAGRDTAGGGADSDRSASGDTARNESATKSAAGGRSAGESRAGNESAVEGAVGEQAPARVTVAGGSPDGRVGSPASGGPRGSPGPTVAGRGRHYLSVRRGEWTFAVVGLPLALIGGAYALAVFYAGTLLSLTVFGLPFVAAALRGARGLGALHRQLVGRLLGEHVEAPARLPRPAGVVARGRVLLTDPIAWRSLLYLVLRLPLGVLGFAAAVAVPLVCGWLIGFPLWVRLLEPGPRPAAWMDAASAPMGLVVLAAVPVTVRALSGVNRRLARLLLGPARAQRRVRELETARATLLAQNTDELRRLERDLHDGTQARLVALAITLSLAEDALAPAAGPDLARLRTLMARARGQTDDTVTELRRLTRGIHPVTLDGGLGEALPGLTATSPVPVTLRLDLPERPDHAVERALYFCAAELLTNVAKHSGARSAELDASATDGRVRLSVRDDGRGGAALGADTDADADADTSTSTGIGTGLAGLAERLAAVDGALRIDSPPGGPTVVTAELPTRL